jgi:hypothetical protein
VGWGIRLSPMTTTDVHRARSGYSLAGVRFERTGDALQMTELQDVKANSQAETIEILDIYCAAYLMAAGQRLLSVTRIDVRCIFEFDDAQGGGSRCLGVWKERRAFVSARDYAESLRAVKRITSISRQEAPKMKDSYDHGAETR